MNKVNMDLFSKPLKCVTEGPALEVCPIPQLSQV